MTFTAFLAEVNRAGYVGGLVAIGGAAPAQVRTNYAFGAEVHMRGPWR